MKNKLCITGVCILKTEIAEIRKKEAGKCRIRTEQHFMRKYIDI